MYSWNKVFIIIFFITLTACSSSQVYFVESDDLYFDPRTQKATITHTASKNYFNSKKNTFEGMSVQPTPSYVNPLVRGEASTFNSDSYSASDSWSSLIENNNNPFFNNPYQSLVNFSLGGLWNSSFLSFFGNPFWNNNRNNTRIWYAPTPVIVNSNPAAEAARAKPIVKRPRESRESYVAPRNQNNNNVNVNTNRNQNSNKRNNNSYSKPKSNNSKPTNYQIAPRGKSRSGGGSSPSKGTSRPRSRR